MKEITPAAMPPRSIDGVNALMISGRIKRLQREFRNYIGGLAKNRKVSIVTSANQLQEIRLDKLAQSLPDEAFTPVQLNLDKPKTVWGATVEVELSPIEGTRTIAIVMNASTFSQEA